MNKRQCMRVCTYQARLAQSVERIINKECGPTHRMLSHGWLMVPTLKFLSHANPNINTNTNTNIYGTHRIMRMVPGALATPFICGAGGLFFCVPIG